MVFGTEPLDASLVPISAGYSKENNSFPALVMEPGAYQDSFSNPSSAPIMSFLRPKVWQSNRAVTGVAGKTLACPFNANNIAGNSIVVRVGLGEVENGSTITLAVTDTLGNTYMQAGNPASQSTTLEAAIFYSVGSNGNGILAGANTVTVTIAGASSVNTAIAVQIDEVFGLISWPGALDQTNTGSNGGSTNVSTGAITTAVPNELVFVVIAAGGGTITPGNNWNNDTAGTLSPVGGNLVSFCAQSRLHTQITALTPTATLSGSNAWAAATASFKTVIAPVEGSFNMMQINGVTPKLDNTNELGVSMYGKNAVAGDTPIQMDPAGRTLIGRIASSVYALASVATSGSTQNSGDLSVGSLTEISIDINTTAQSGTSPTIQYFWERKGADGIYYILWQSAVLTLAANTLSTSVGAGMAYNQSVGLTGRLRWAVGGSATPTFTHSLNVYGK